MSFRPVTLLLTRPRASSEAFAQTLDLGSAALVISPLLMIEQVGKLPDMSLYSGVVFTSAQGARAYIQMNGPKLPVAYAVGEATAEEAASAAAKVLSADGTADDLVSFIASTTPLPERLLHVRGVHSRGNVAARLTDAGVPTDEAVLYDQVETPLNPQGIAALEDNSLVIVPLFSPRSAALFEKAGPITASLWGAAISSAVANSLKSNSFSRVEIAKRPDRAAMTTLVQSMLSEACLLEARRGAR